MLGNNVFERIFFGSLLAIGLTTGFESTVLAQSTEESQVADITAICDQSIPRLQNSGEVLQLFQPNFTSLDAVQQQQLFAERLYLCSSYLLKVENLDNELRNTYAILNQLAELFIVFAGTEKNTTFPREGADGEIARLLQNFKAERSPVNLQTSTDPVIQKLRDEVKIPAPEGLIYVKYYPESTLSVMPEIIQRALQGEQEQQRTGWTYRNGRYVAILEKAFLQQIDLSEEQRSVVEAEQQRTLSHELAHAYILSQLKERNRLPKWFIEGFAIHFSGSHRTTIVVKQGKVTRIEPPQEYKNYELIFRYLESASGGKENFYALIRQAVQENSVTAIARAVDINPDQNPDEMTDVLLKKAHGWENRGSAIALFIAPILFILLLFIVFELMVGFDKMSHRFQHHE